MAIIQQIAKSSESTSFTLHGEPRLGGTRWAAGAKPRTQAELIEEGNQFHEIVEAYLASLDPDTIAFIDEFDYALAREAYFSDGRLQIPQVSYDPASTPIFFGKFKL